MSSDWATPPTRSITSRAPSRSSTGAPLPWMKCVQTRLNAQESAWLSMRATRAPARPSKVAAVEPARLAPTTATSNSRPPDISERASYARPERPGVTFVTNPSLRGRARHALAQLVLQREAVELRGRVGVGDRHAQHVAVGAVVDLEAVVRQAQRVGAFAAVR